MQPLRSPQCTWYCENHEQSHMSRRSRLKRLAFLGLRLGVGLGLIAWLYSTLGSDTLFQAWKKIDIGLFFLAVLIQIASFVIASGRWWILLQGAGIRIPFLEALSPYYLGLFFNQFLPTGIGGDSVRVYNLYKKGYAVTPLAASTMIDRLIGLLALLILASLAVIFPGTQVVPAAVVTLVSITLAALAIGTLLFLFLPLPSWMAVILYQIGAHSIAGRFLKVLWTCRSYKGYPRLLLATLFLSFIVQSLMILVYAILAHALDLDIPLTILFIAVPLVFVATNLPFTIGGLGVREGVLVAVLGLFGVGIMDSGQIASVYLIALWLGVLPGGWSLIFKRSSNAR